MATRFQRTDKDFTVTSIAGLKDVIQRHTVAGFEPIPDAVVHRRFFQLTKFLQDNRLTTRTLFKDLSELTGQAELKNADLSDKGFYFLQTALAKWEDRFHKDQGEENEWKFLEKWYKAFLDRNPDLN